MCARCNEQHDFALSCEEAQRKKEDAESLAANQAYFETEGFKACPGCNIMTSRISGCNLMTCKSAICKAKPKGATKFCYLCAKDITEEGYPHILNVPNGGYNGTNCKTL